MGLRKFLLAFVMLLTVVTPAEAFEPCALWERQVYAVTAEGGLVEHRFCLDANRTISRWSGERVVATSGWADVTTAFWSGQEHGSGVYYRVVGSGLDWSRDLELWQQLAPGIDWGAYTSLISTEPGVIYGTERSGLVRRWQHTGWQDGADTWGRQSVAATLPEGTALAGHTSIGFLGGGTSTTVNVWSDSLTRSKLRYLVPDGVDRGTIVPFDLEQKYPNPAFARTFAGDLVVLLPTSCSKADRPWKAGDRTGGGYSYLFTGNYLPNGHGPVEWQCDGPPGTPAN